MFEAEVIYPIQVFIWVMLVYKNKREIYESILSQVFTSSETVGPKSN